MIPGYPEPYPRQDSGALFAFVLHWSTHRFYTSLHLHILDVEFLASHTDQGAGTTRTMFEYLLESDAFATGPAPSF